MKFLILSDLHLEFRTFEVPRAEYDAVILAGDIKSPGSRAVHWAKRASTFGGKPVFYVPGNHEYYGHEMKVELSRMRMAARGSNVHVLDANWTTLGNVRILGCTLWTDFEFPISPQGSIVPTRDLVMEEARLCMNDYYCIRHRDDLGGGLLRPEITRSIHFRQLAWLNSVVSQPWDGPTIVITHHGPSGQSVGAEYVDDWLTPAYVSALPASTFAGVDLWVHGHVHASFDYVVPAGGDDDCDEDGDGHGESLGAAPVVGGAKGCRVITNPRGYPVGPMRVPENERFNPTFVVEIGGPMPHLGGSEAAP